MQEELAMEMTEDNALIEDDYIWDDLQPCLGGIHEGGGGFDDDSIEGHESGKDDKVVLGASEDIICSC